MILYFNPSVNRQYIGTIANSGESYTRMTFDSVEIKLLQ